jgi:DNA-binding response OmpR family regulator
LNTVLLIDDNPLQLRIREQVLRDAGFEVHIATSGDSALALMRSPVGKNVGAVVTDHIMPGISGPALVRQLSAASSHVPIIVISGMAEAQYEYEGLDVIFHEKPCPPPELIRLVRLSIEQAA